MRTDTTGLYPFTLLVRNEYSNGNQDSIDRGHPDGREPDRQPIWSGLGARWIEHLCLISPRHLGRHILLVDGDGSGTWYHKVNATTWVGPKGTYQDTLTYSGLTHRYTRTLAPRHPVVFDASG